MKILIVEDQADARKLISIALKRTAYELLEASNGAEALQVVKDQRPKCFYSTFYARLYQRIPGMRNHQGNP